MLNNAFEQRKEEGLSKKLPDNLAVSLYNLEPTYLPPKGAKHYICDHTKDDVLSLWRFVHMLLIILWLTEDGGKQFTNIKTGIPDWEYSMVHFNTYTWKTSESKSIPAFPSGSLKADSAYLASALWRARPNPTNLPFKIPQWISSLVSRTLSVGPCQVLSVEEWMQSRMQLDFVSVPRQGWWWATMRTQFRRCSSKRNERGVS